MDEKINKLFSDLDKLGAGHGSVEGLQEVIDQVRGRLVETRQKVASLRPGAKDYEQQLTQLAGVSQALELQAQSAEADLLAEVTRVKRAAVEKTGKIVGAYKDRIRSLEEEALQHLLDAFEILNKRGEIGAELEDRTGLLQGLANDIRLGDLQVGNGNYQPFGIRWQTTPTGPATFIRRFAEKAGQAGPPLDPEQAWIWFITGR